MHKAKAPIHWTGAFGCRRLTLGDAHLLSLGSLGALGDLEFDFLVLVQRTVAIGINRGVVNENVRAAISLLDEAEALFYL